MDTKDIIIYLIIQDMKYEQMINRFRQAGLELENGGILIQEAVLFLFGIPMEENGDFPYSSDDLNEAYYNFINKAVESQVSSFDSGLEQLAEACYYSVKAILHIEKSRTDGREGL